MTALAAVSERGAGLEAGWEWDGFRRCQVKASRDQAGNLVGEGIIAYENKDVWRGEFQGSVLDRTGTLTKAEEHGMKVTGSWVGGLLQGEVRETKLHTGWLEGYYKDGVQHGFFREFGPRFKCVNILRSAGRCYRGLLRGWLWQVGVLHCTTLPLLH